MIHISNACKEIKGQKILDIINLTIEDGKTYGFIGRNGSGKTMLMKAICGFISLNSGSITVNGKTIGKDIDFPPDTGIIIEKPAFIPYMSAVDNLTLLAEIRKKIGRTEIEEVIRKVGLDPHNKKKVKAFSLGMKQRLAFAQAIMESPTLLILDEPMNALDKEGVVFVRNMLQEMKSKGITILICSHISDDIDMLCDRVFEMERGVLTEDLTKRERND